MHRNLAPTLSVFSVLLLAACSKEQPAGDDSPKPTPPSFEPAKKPDASAAKAPGPNEGKTHERKTPYPSDAEWQEMKKEVTVKGSSALACETKILDGYLRLLCKKNKLGAPTTLHMKTPLPKNALAGTGDDALTLVHPFAPGTRIEATFSWEKASHPFVAEWPKGQPQPQIVGIFEGAASPLNRLAPRTAELLSLVAKFESPPKDCLSPSPMWGDHPTYAKVVEFGNKKSQTTSSRCSPLMDENEKETGKFNCCVAFNEGADSDDDEGYGSSTAICFDLDQKRVPDEKTMECQFAG